MADVIKLPTRDEWTVEQQEEDLLDLHRRLMEHLAQDKPHKGEAISLTIDDVMQLCEMIEERLGAEWFNDE